MPAETRTEWAARYIWPDGSSEIDRNDSRKSAELDVRIADHQREDGRGTAVAELVYRTVWSGEWSRTDDLADLAPTPVPDVDRNFATESNRWAVRYTWSDGHVEMRRALDRLAAEETAARANECRESGWRYDTAEAVGRLILTSEWMPVPVPAPEPPATPRTVVITRDDLVHAFRPLPGSGDPNQCGYDYGDEGLCDRGPAEHMSVAPTETAVAVLTESEAGTFVCVGTDRRPVWPPFDGENLADVARAVLLDMGWQVDGEWTQTFGGSSGAAHEAPVSKR